MLYDLNVPWTPTTNPADLERTISFLSSLGYHTLALTHSLSSSAIPSQIHNPIPTNLTLPPSTTILRRCTLTLSDPAQNHRLPALAAAYDILALRPTHHDDRAFLAACNSITEHSIISLDLTQRYPWHWKPKPFMTAVNRGVRIEICYSQATAGGSEARRNFVGNLMGILRATKGRGLVVSGEARGALGCRAPADVLNLLGVWGLARERGVEAMGVHPRGVVVNEGIKRSGFRGVVDVIEGGERVVEKGKGKEVEKGAQGVGKKGNGKRKMEQDGPDGTPQISKREAKRQRLEALKAAKQSSQAEDTPSKALPKDIVSLSGGTQSENTSTPESDTPSTIKEKANG